MHSVCIEVECVALSTMQWRMREMRITKLIGTVALGVLLSSASYAAGVSSVADAAMKSDAAAVRALLAKKADVNAPQVDGTTALHWAVYNEDLDLVEQLLAAGANPGTATAEGATPLYLASVA